MTAALSALVSFGEGSLGSATSAEWLGLAVAVAVVHAVVAACAKGGPP